jgi:hypothetical protein
MLRKPLRITGRDTEWRHLATFAAGRGPRVGLVAGRRRQGKTLLLEALARATGGLHLTVPQATGTEALRLLADEVGAWTGEPVAVPSGWEAFLSRLVGLAARSGRPIVLDDVPHLLRIVPDLAGILARELDGAGGDPAVLLGSSVPPATAALRTGPLRDRVALDLTVRPLDHRAAARLWNVDHDPLLAVGVHAVVGGTVAYHRFACADSPADTADFDSWVQRTVLEPTSALFCEARYLTAAADVRDPALYHSLLAAVAAGTGVRGAIADHVGRRSADIGHHLNLLEDAGLLRREPDVFRAGRTSYRVTDPLVAFHHVVMRPRWAHLECGRAAEVWKDAHVRFAGHVAVHFAQLCREHAPALVGGQIGHVGTGVVADTRDGPVPVDLAVLAPAVPAEPPRILALGVTSWTRPLGAADAARLHRARAVLGERGYDVRDARLVCAGGAGVEACDGVLTVTPADLYACP